MEQEYRELEAYLRELRREFHRYPELCWTEFRTSARVIEELEKLGLTVRYGRQIHVEQEMRGLPEEEVLQACMRRAKSEGARPDLVDAMEGGFTGCMTLIEGALPGPFTGIRVDMDALPLQESRDAEHLPARGGYASLHDGVMHACGHDAHTAIGLGIARLLVSRRDRLRGRVLLVFQPGEEGLRGAASLAEAGHFDDCDCFFGLHVGMESLPVGTVCACVQDLLASTKFDVTFYGKASHAGKAPEQGRNALAAAAEAITGILSIPRPEEGISRANVGTLHGGTARNIIPDRAVLQGETRGGTSKINAYMEGEARRICRLAAERAGCTLDFAVTARAESADCDPLLVRRSAEILAEVEGVDRVLTDFSFGACEDVTRIMRRVQARGGMATELLFGMPLKGPHHSSSFDVDERVMGLAARCMATLAEQISLQPLLPAPRGAAES